mgnify:CR=1 FL=1
MSNGLKAKIRAAADRVAALQAEVNKLVNVASEEFMAAGYGQTEDPTGKAVERLNDAEDHLIGCLQLLNTLGGEV